MGKKSFLHYSFGQKCVFYACFMLIRSWEGGKNLGVGIFLNKNLLGLGVHTSARTITRMVEHDYLYGRAFGRHAMLDPRSTMPRNGRPKTSIMN